VNEVTSTNGDSRRILVIGGGISGVTAAVEASEVGFEVVLVERDPYLGGRVVQMNKYFPKMCPPLCGLEHSFKVLRKPSRITVLTQTQVKSITGGPGAFSVEVERQPRFVNEQCTACGACVDVCPVERPNSFNHGMDATKAVYLPFAGAVPFRHVIDSEHCDGKSCGKCVEACEYDAIDLEEAPRVETYEVGAVIVATGWKPFDAAALTNLGYGSVANVVTNVEMERLAALDGPTGGKILRPSDKKPPESVVFVQCAGSRDENHNAYCSAVCCMASLKHVRYLLDQNPETNITVFYIDVRTPGRLEDFYAEIQKEERVTLIKGKAARITEDPATKDLVVEAEDTLDGKRVTMRANMAVLATGMVSEASAAGLPAAWTLDAHGFVADPLPAGVFAAGTARRPQEVAACVRDATGAALKAISCIGME
jgi:quinone-modifying oxidoreductase, subunit QmoA